MTTERREKHVLLSPIFIKNVSKGKCLLRWCKESYFLKRTRCDVILKLYLTIHVKVMTAHYIFLICYLAVMIHQVRQHGRQFFYGYGYGSPKLLSN